MRTAIGHRHAYHRSGVRRAVRAEKTDSRARRIAEARAKGGTIVGAILELPTVPSRQLKICCGVFLTKFSDCRRVQLVFSHLNPGMETFGRIVRQDRYLLLSDDSPVINFLIDIMHRAARHGFASCESLFPRFQSRKFWQKR